MSQRLITLALLFVTSLAVAACDNTVRGVGQDVQDTAEAVEDVAQ